MPKEWRTDASVTVVNLWELEYHPQRYQSSFKQPLDGETELVAEILLWRLEPGREYVLWRHNGWMEIDPTEITSIQVAEFKAKGTHMHIRDNRPFLSDANVRWELQPVIS